MDYVSTLLDRYYEIFQFVINCDQYREFINLKKQALRPYSALFAQDAEAEADSELSAGNVSVKKTGGSNPVAGDIDYISRLLELQSVIVDRVWQKFRHRLLNISEWNPTLDKIDVFHLLGGSDPVVVIPTTATKALGLDESQLKKQGVAPHESFEKLLGIDRHDFFTIAIDPQINRKDAWTLIKQALAAYLGTKITPRNPKKRAIKKYEAIKLVREKHTFEETGRMFGVKMTTAHKAFYRDFEDIFGSPYKPGENKRNEFPHHQLTKTCPTCSDYKTCKKLCPEMEAYISQDYGSQKVRIL